MSSLRNAIPKRAYKERAQPHSRRKFGLLEKHKDYVIRAREYHKKEETLRRLKEKAANRNPDEFYFRMIKAKTVDGVHRPASEANKYTPEELMLMRTQDMGYVLQKIQSEKKASIKVEKLKAVLHSLDNQPANKHIYYAEDRFVIAVPSLVLIYEAEISNKLMERGKDSERNKRQMHFIYDQKRNVITSLRSGVKAMRNVPPFIEKGKKKKSS
ncbi:hypothetical protein Cgig2_015704 [Carnegiea gigantea]|uniref:U3 small nucleolar RNA-associated protein 11 n=1 Tax=Carnegiea gigantea TaxID=171969 RepID=A0A9Q1GR46_9CARY|nr:hypothetical protein Cgig2_015704 [Carnegiea gigantea]